MNVWLGHCAAQVSADWYSLPSFPRIQQLPRAHFRHSRESGNPLVALRSLPSFPRKRESTRCLALTTVIPAKAGIHTVPCTHYRHSRESGNPLVALHSLPAFRGFVGVPDRGIFFGCRIPGCPLSMTNSARRSTSPLRLPGIEVTEFCPKSVHNYTGCSV